MQTTNTSEFKEPKLSVEDSLDEQKYFSEEWFSESFESLIPIIQEKWPNLARQTLEATRGSLSEMIQVISEHSGKTNSGVQEQLDDIFRSAGQRTKNLAQSLEPLEKQLEDLLDDLNDTLRPRIEKPIRTHPLLAIGIATGIGVLLGLMLKGSNK